MNQTREDDKNVALSCHCWKQGGLTSSEGRVHMPFETSADRLSRMFRGTIEGGTDWLWKLPPGSHGCPGLECLWLAFFWTVCWITLSVTCWGIWIVYSGHSTLLQTRYSQHNRGDTWKESRDQSTLTLGHSSLTPGRHLMGFVGADVGRPSWGLNMQKGWTVVWLGFRGLKGEAGGPARRSIQHG